MAATTGLFKVQFFDTNGDPLSGGKLFTYTTGTSTPLATYTDSGGGTPNANPVVLDARGEADVWLDTTLTYRFVLKTSADVTIWTVDGVRSSDTILRSDLSASSGSSLVGFIQSGSGGIAENLQSRGRWIVYLTDFMSDADRANLRAGSTVAADDELDKARDEVVARGGGKVIIPAGNISLNNWRFKTGVIIEGDGYEATFIHQAAAGNPAINCLADATTGQLIGIGLVGVTVEGHASATVRAVILDATTPYVITRSKFDYYAHNTYTAIEIPDRGGGEVYNNYIKVVSDDSTSTAVLTSGAYNTYDFFLTNCASGVAMTDLTGNAIWDRVVADGQLNFNGANYTVRNAIVEGITGTSLGGGAVIRAHGNRIVMIAPHVQDVPVAKAEAAFSTQNNNVWICPTTSGTSDPNYAFYFQSSPTPVIINPSISSAFKLNQHISAADLALATFSGDCSSIIYGDWPLVAKLRYPTIPVGSVAYGSLGTSTTPVSGTIYLAEVRVDATKSITGVGVLNGATVGTDEYVVALFDSSGTFLKQSAGAGVTTSGADAFQNVPLEAAVIVTPGRYWIGVQLNGTTDRFRTIAASTFVDVLTKSSVGSFGTMPNQTVPTTFTADVGPIAYLY